MNHTNFHSLPFNGKVDFHVLFFGGRWWCTRLLCEYSTACGVLRCDGFDLLKIRVSSFFSFELHAFLGFFLFLSFFFFFFFFLCVRLRRLEEVKSVGERVGSASDDHMAQWSNAAA
jgi:hypothetical protein